MAAPGGHQIMEKTWEKIQKKAFTKWFNLHLMKRGKAVDELQEDLKDGLKLLSFLEVISGKTVATKYEKKPNLRIQKIQNLDMCLKFLTQVEKVPLISIGAEDICDGNIKLILGMIWTIIQKYQIADISEEELSAKEALLLWCKKKTAGYKDVKVDNFHLSFQDGLAFCALIHKHRPDLLDFNSCSKDTPRENLNKAFEVAEKELGIPKLLDVDDMLDVVRPDEKSVMTYVSLYYHAFASSKKDEDAARRIGRLVDMQSSTDQMKADYNDRAHKWSEWTKAKIDEFSSKEIPNSLAGILEAIDAMAQYKSNEKPEKSADKLSLEALFNSINLKLKANNRSPFVANEGLSTADIQKLWDQLLQAEKDRDDLLRKELERQEKIDLLNKKLTTKLAQLEQWINNKEKYLNREEKVDSLNTAKEKLKQHEDFYDDYAQSKARVDECKKVVSQLNQLGDANAQATQEKLDSVLGRHGALLPSADKKKEDLKKKLEIQEKIEMLRLEFTKLATEYNRWAGASIETINERDFGESLEEVKEYRKTLEADHGNFTKISTEKLEALQGVWKQLQDHGVTDVKYTVLTVKDMEQRHNSVLEAIKQQLEAYEEEVKRQELMEEKRKEFAAMAQKFIDHLAERKKSLVEHAKNGEADQLLESIPQLYAEGAPEQELIAKLAEFTSEMNNLGITENKHTEFNLNILNNRSALLGKFVKGLLAALKDEKSAKSQYETDAKEVSDWIESVMPFLNDVSFDNTLEGALMKNQEMTEYKTGAKAENSAKKEAVLNLYKSINALLKKNHRPEYAPSQGLTVTDLSSAWDALNAAEKAKEAAVKAELDRQQKLSQLVKTFNAESSDLSEWTAAKQKYLENREQISTLFQAQFQMSTFTVTATEISEKKAKIALLVSLSDDLAALNYKDMDSIKEKTSAISASYEDLNKNADEKKKYLEEQLEIQMKNTGIHDEFLNAVKEFEAYVKEKEEEISTTTFGFNLEAVVAFEADLKKSDEEINKNAQDQLSTIEALAKTLAEMKFKDVEAKMTVATNAKQELDKELESRQANYAKEVEKQKQFEEKRKEFAGLAKDLVDSLAKQKAGFDSTLAQSASPAEKSGLIEALWENGKMGAEKLEVLKNLSKEMAVMGVFGNKHTSYSMPNLNTRVQQHNNTAKNVISGLAEEAQLQERIKSQEKELAAQEAIENMVVDYSKKARSLNQFLENEEDHLNEPINVSSIEEVDALIKELAEHNQKIEGQTSAKDDLAKLAEEMKNAGVKDFSGASIEEINEKWTSVANLSASRGKSLEDELKEQKQNDEICKDYAAQAKSFSEYLNSTKDAIGSLSGAVEQQLENFKKISAGFVEKGKEDLQKLEVAAQKVSGNNLKNKYTDLNFRTLVVEYAQLKDSMTKQEKVLTNEVFMKKNANVSSAQLAEFKEVFSVFDKDGDGTLNKFEFRACLTSLSMTLADHEVDDLFKKHGNANGVISFETFSNFMSERSKDTDSQESILESFKAIAKDKEFVLAEDLRRHMSEERVQYLLKSMPAYEGVEGGYDYKKWAQKAFH